MTCFAKVFRFVICCILFAAVAFGEPNEDLIVSVASGDLDGVKEALSSGADIDFQDKRTKQSALMASVLRGHTDIVAYLLSQGADVTIPEKDGYTPAHGAAFQGRVDIFKLLKQHGVDILHDFHSDGFAPLHRACWGKEERHAETVDYLLRQGADPYMKGGNDKKQTCLKMTENSDTHKVLREFILRQREEEL